MEQKDSIEFVRLTEREKYFMAFCWTCRSVYAPLHALLCESCVHYNSLYLSISQCALSRCMINLTVAATWTMLHFETNLIRFFEASDCFCFVWNERALLSPSPYFYRYLIQMMCPSPFEYCIDVELLLCSTFVGASQSRSNCVAGIVKSTTSIQSTVRKSVRLVHAQIVNNCHSFVAECFKQFTMLEFLLHTFTHTVLLAIRCLQPTSFFM